MSVKRIVHGLTCLLMCVCLIQVPVLAAETGDHGSFDVQAILPKNQLNDQINYFQLLVEPGEKQVIKIKVCNHSESEQRFLIKVNQATTNKNGLLVYDEEKKTNDDSIDIPISSVVKPNSTEVTIAGRSEQDVELQLDIPNKPLKGILLGGITVSKKEQAEAANDGIAIKNSLSYTIALLLTAAADTPIYGETGLELKQVQLVSSKDRRVFQVAIQNQNPEIVKDLSIEGKIYTEERKEIVAEKSMDNVRFAPNSTLLFELDVENPMNLSGNYWFEGTILSSNQSWDFTEEISVKESGKVIVHSKKQGFNWPHLIIVFALLGLLLVIRTYRMKTSK